MIFALRWSEFAIALKLDDKDVFFIHSSSYVGKFGRTTPRITLFKSTKFFCFFEFSWGCLDMDSLFSSVDLIANGWHCETNRKQDLAAPETSLVWADFGGLKRYMKREIH